MNVRVAAFAAAVIATAGVATAQFYDDFDSYATGSSMHGQGGWKGWQNDPTWTAYTTDMYSVSAPNSVDISGNADLVHEFSGATSGMWTFSAMQYIPDDFSGISYMILLNTYDDIGVFNWSTQVSFDGATGLVTSEFEGATLPMITGRWVEFRNEIDLDADTQTIYYDGVMLTSKSWVDGLSGGGAVNIGAVDLFANGASPIYYDNVSLIPAPAAFTMLLLGAGLTRRRR